MKKKLASTVIACSVALTQISDITVFADSSLKENINKDNIDKEAISSENNTKKETKILDNSNKSKVVDIQDNTLKRLINKTISSSRPIFGDITVGDLESLTELVSTNSGDSPSSLDGLEYAINLEVIRLPYSKATDLKPIENLSKLREISFDDNRGNDGKGIIDFDLDFLSNFPNLRIFSLRGSYLTNLTNSGNYKGSENLALDIRRSKITNIDLFRGWTLRRFSISDTGVLDFRPIGDMKIDALNWDSSYVQIPVEGENNITTFKNPFYDSEGNIVEPYSIGLGGSYNKDDNTITIDTSNISSNRNPIEYRVKMKYTSSDGTQKTEWTYFYVRPNVYDSIKPKIEGAEDVVITCDIESFDLMEGVVAKDVESLGIVDLVIESGSINFGVKGDNKIIYKATDRWGNTTIKERTITVRGSSPVINGADNKQIELGKEFNPLDGVVATDKDDTKPPTIEVEGKVNTKVEGKYILTYKVIDSDGNVTEVKREITVVDSRDKNKIVEIQDSSFKKLINYTLNPKRPSTQNITLGEMKSITTLSTKQGTGYNIKSIKGIEEANNLVNLEIEGQNLSDISEIENLSKLENVSFESNRLESIDFKIIESLPKINTFNISSNTIRTLKNSSDFKGKNDLTLVIYNNPIRDISTLENWTLKYLNMGYTNVIDFRPIGTMRLDNLTVASPLMKFPKVLRTGNEVRFANTVYNSEGNLMIPKNIEGGRYDSTTNEIIFENVTEDGTRKLEYSDSIKYTTIGGSKYQAVSTLKGSIEISSDISPIIDGIHNTYAKQGETFNSLKGVRAIDKDGYDIDIISVNGNLNVDEIGDYTLIYIASDIYGNTKSENREVKVRPMVRGINANGKEENILIEAHLYNHPNSGKVIKFKKDDFVLGKGDTFNIKDFISVEGDRGGYITETHRVSTSTPGFYRVEAKYRSHSAGADENSTVAFTVEVKDSSRPKINLNYINAVEPTVGKEYTREMALQGISIEDEEENLKDKIEIIGLEDVNTTDDDVYSEITYSITDSNGLKATYDRTLVTRHSPKIGRAEDIIVEQNSDIDLYDIDVDYSIWYYGSVIVEGDNVVDGRFDTSKLGEHIVKYTVDDGEGRITELERKITVVPKSNENPVIHGANDITIKVGDTFKPLDGVTATDKEDITISKIEVTGTVNTSEVGIYKLTYKVTDSDNNVTTVERVVTVRSNEKPVIKGADDITIKVGDTFNPLDGVTATDKEDVTISKIEVTGDIDTNRVGTYILTYKVTDSDGNITTLDRKVIVKGDTKPITPPNIESIKPTEFEEIVGLNRFETVTKISSKWNSAENVVITNAYSIVDSLSATPFASSKDAPILLSDKDNLTDITKNELKRLKTKNVYLIGGYSVLNDNIEKELKNIGINVVRIAGKTRFETSIEIAKYMTKDKKISNIVIANGIRGLADAVTISPVASEKNMPIILSDIDKLPSGLDFIKNQNISKTYIIGGNHNVSEKLSKEIDNITGDVIRIYGEHREETNMKVIETFYNTDKLNNIFVSKNGINKESDLVDSLAIGSLAAKEKSPILLVGNKLKEYQKNFIKKVKALKITKVGGNGNEEAMNEIKDIVNSK